MFIHSSHQTDLRTRIWYAKHVIVCGSTMADQHGGARRKNTAKKKLKGRDKTSSPSKKCFSFSYLENKGIVNYGNCSLTFRLDRRPGLLGVYMILLKRVPELLVHLTAYRRSRFEFDMMMKLLSVQNPEVTQNCFDGLVVLLNKMNEKAEALGGVAVTPSDASIQTVNFAKATFDDLMTYLGMCRRICDECNVWLSVFYVARDLVTYFEDYDSITPEATKPIVTGGFRDTYSILSNLLETELKRYEFIVAGSTYQCGILRE